MKEDETAEGKGTVTVTDPLHGGSGYTYTTFASGLVRSEPYKVLHAVAKTPTEKERILELPKLLKDLEDPVLYAYAHDEVAVGPRIGVADLAETTIKTLAILEWQGRTRRRQLIVGISVSLVTGVVLAFVGAYISGLF